MSPLVISVVSHVSSRLRSRMLCLGLASTICIVTGCGTSGAPKVTGQVTVKVTTGGQPVAGGAVQLVSTGAGVEQGKGAFGGLDDKGTVELASVEVGTYTVTVMPPAPLDPDPSKPSPPPADTSNIPPQFHSQMTSTLKAEVKRGKNEFVFELKP